MRENCCPSTEDDRPWDSPTEEWIAGIVDHYAEFLAGRCQSPPDLSFLPIDCQDETRRMLAVMDLLAGHGAAPPRTPSGRSRHEVTGSL